MIRLMYMKIVKALLPEEKKIGYLKFYMMYLQSNTYVKSCGFRNLLALRVVRTRYVRIVLNIPKVHYTGGSV